MYLFVASACRCDSTYREYIPELSESEETDILTDPSTPSSCRQTPDICDELRFRSSTLSDIPFNRDSRAPTMNRSFDDITSARSTTSSVDGKFVKFSPPSMTGEVWVTSDI